jgi:hypothetical protein
MGDGAASARLPIAQRRTARFERLPCVLDLVVYFSPAAAVEEAAAGSFSWSCGCFTNMQFPVRAMHA